MALSLPALTPHWEQQSTADVSYPQRRAAWSKLSELGLPRPRSEAFTWVPLTRLTDSDFANSSVALDWASALQVPPGVEFAANDSSTAWFLPEESDPLALACLALHGSAARVLVAAHSSPNQPLRLTLPALSSNTTQAARLSVHLHAGAELQLHIEGPDADHHGVSNWVLDIRLDEGARLSVLELLPTTPLGRNYLRVFGAQHAQSAVDWLSIDGGGHLHRSAQRWQLQGEQATCALRGLSVVQGENHSHRHISLEHAAPRCTSRQYFRHILQDKAQASLDGTVRVHRGAEDTLSEQLVNSLLLNPGTRASCKPNLLIYHDAVKCSHGHTCGELNSDELFYLLSRGIPVESAQHLLLQAFTQSVLAEHPNKSQRAQAVTHLQSHWKAVSSLIPGALS